MKTSPTTRNSVGIIPSKRRATVFIQPIVYHLPNFPTPKNHPVSNPALPPWRKYPTLKWLIDLNTHKFPLQSLCLNQKIKAAARSTNYNHWRIIGTGQRALTKADKVLI
jgi:hypothetical protein